MAGLKPYNVLLCSRCRYFIMDAARHVKELGAGHAEAYIGHCKAWDSDVRVMDTDGGCNRRMDCPYYAVIPEIKGRVFKKHEG